MNRLLSLVGLLLGGWAGWLIGVRFGFGAALILSVIGTGAGLYVARSVAREYF